jgi:alpha-1,2-mannosyltransferase
MGSATTAVLRSLTADPEHGLDLARRTGLPSGSLYPALIRLQRSGLIEAHWSNGRRTYRRVGAPPAEKQRDDLRRWLPAALAALITAWAVLTRSAHVRLSDLGVYTGAVDGLLHGASLYDFITAGNAPFTYPPFAGLVFLPLADLPAFPLQLAWTLATIATVAALALLPGRRAHAPAYALILVLSAPVSSDLKYGQVSIFLAALVAADVLALRHSRWQGVLIGLAAAIKLTPLIFIAMLWFAGRRRAAITATTTFAACGALAALALPADSWRFWTTEVSHVSRLGYITSVGNQSLNGALMRFDLAAPVRSAIVLLLGGAVAALALHRAARLGRGGDWLSALVVVGAASVVLSPVSWTHHQVWLVLAVLLPVRGPSWARRPAWTRRSSWAHHPAWMHHPAWTRRSSWAHHPAWVNHPALARHLAWVCSLTWARRLAWMRHPDSARHSDPARHPDAMDSPDSMRHPNPACHPHPPRDPDLVHHPDAMDSPDAMNRPDLVRRAWQGCVLVVMVQPVTALGPPLWSNSRLLLAITIAALLPLASACPSRSCADATSPSSVPGRRTSA